MLKFRIFILAIFMAVANHMFAFEVDGIFYAVNPQNNSTVYVCKSDSYQGFVKIPSTITYADKQFSVTRIEEGAFYNCKQLRSVSVPNTISEIPKGAFANCTWLDVVELPNTIKSIGRNAFQRTNLTSIKLPSSLTVIHPFAFMECRKIREITIPRSVKEIQTSVFYNCRSLKKVVFEASSSTLKVFSDDDSTTDIFYNCPIEDVYLGRRIVFLGRNYNIFSEKEGKYIEININDGQINSKKQFVQILRLPSNISNYESMFANESKSELQGFLGLKEIHIANPNPPQIYSYTFTNLKETCVLYVPKGSKSRYEMASGWDVFYNIKEE